MIVSRRYDHKVEHYRFYRHQPTQIKHIPFVEEIPSYGKIDAIFAVVAVATVMGLIIGSFFAHSLSSL